MNSNKIKTNLLTSTSVKLIESKVFYPNESFRQMKIIEIYMTLKKIELTRSDVNLHVLYNDLTM